MRPFAIAHLAYGHLTYRRLLSFTRTPLTGSAHAPPIKGVRADSASQAEAAKPTSPLRDSRLISRRYVALKNTYSDDMSTFQKIRVKVFSR